MNKIINEEQITKIITEAVIKFLKEDAGQFNRYETEDDIERNKLIEYNKDYIIYKSDKGFEVRIAGKSGSIFVSLFENGSSVSNLSIEKSIKVQQQGFGDDIDVRFNIRNIGFGNMPAKILVSDLELAKKISKWIRSVIKYYEWDSYIKYDQSLKDYNTWLLNKIQ